MTQQILEEFKQRVASLQLQPFSDGRFEVFLNEIRIFSKLETRRFPEYEEIRSDSYEAALADVESAIRFHVETFGNQVLEVEPPALEAYIAEANVDL